MKLNNKIILKGNGLHSGNKCRLIIEPFETPEILIRSGDNIQPLRELKTSGTNRGSDYIFQDGTIIKTCEHVLSALTGLDIFSGVLVTAEGGEMPALDGCSRLLCSELLKNCSDDENVKNAYELSEPVIIHSEDRKRFVAAFPDDRLNITYTVEYDYIGAQIYDYVHSTDNYVKDISGARTFAMKSEIEYLRSHGMSLGGSLDNAVLIGDKIQAKGGLRWENEFVRHKVLDLIGDLASLGRPLKAHIIALRAGHEYHLRLADKLKGEFY